MKNTEQTTTVAPIEMKNSVSEIDVEGMGTTRLVTRFDGSKVPFVEAKLREDLTS